jgi:hypothetical protein
MGVSTQGIVQADSKGSSGYWQNVLNHQPVDKQDEVVLTPKRDEDVNEALQAALSRGPLEGEAKEE